MPFKSKAQAKKAFATGGFGGKIDPKQWAAETPNMKKLPKKVKPKAKAKKHSKADDHELVSGIFK